MKVKEDYEDSCGRNPLIFTGYKNLQEIHDYLWHHYQGYHFCIMFDETKDEYEALEPGAWVYFSDEALDEIALYSDCEVKKRR